MPAGRLGGPAGGRRPPVWLKIQLKYSQLRASAAKSVEIPKRPAKECLFSLPPYRRREPAVMYGDLCQGCERGYSADC
jgi:hypothetical protein